MVGIRDRTRPGELRLPRGVVHAPVGADAALERLQDYVDELTAIGIELKDYETGLIDFPGEREGRRVWLCWRLDEDRVANWHELDTGFIGRRPL